MEERGLEKGRMCKPPVKRIRDTNLSMKSLSIKPREHFHWLSLTQPIRILSFDTQIHTSREGRESPREKGIAFYEIALLPPPLTKTNNYVPILSARHCQISVCKNQLRYLIFNTVALHFLWYRGGKLWSGEYNRLIKNKYDFYTHFSSCEFLSHAGRHCTLRSYYCSSLTYIYMYVYTRIWVCGRSTGLHNERFIVPTSIYM